jgi:hypothetical protein
VEPANAAMTASRRDWKARMRAPHPKAPIREASTEARAAAAGAPVRVGCRVEGAEVAEEVDKAAPR